MKNKFTTRQMINVELAARAINEANAAKLKRHIPNTEQAATKIAFNCECADPSCDERIILSLVEYKKLHNDFAHFIIIKDHIEPVVEKLVKSTNNIALVEKYSLK